MSVFLYVRQNQTNQSTNNQTPSLVHLQQSTNQSQNQNQTPTNQLASNQIPNHVHRHRLVQNRISNQTNTNQSTNNQTPSLIHLHHSTNQDQNQNQTPTNQLASNQIPNQVYRYGLAQNRISNQIQTNQSTNDQTPNLTHRYGLLRNRISNQTQRNQSTINQSFGGQILEEGDYLNDDEIDERYPRFNSDQSPERATNLQTDYIINEEDKNNNLICSICLEQYNVGEKTIKLSSFIISKKYPRFSFLCFQHKKYACVTFYIRF